MFKKTALSLMLFGITQLANAAVLTTVKPLGFIANAITDGVTQTDVLLPVTASPHDYSLKPSDVAKLQSAQLVVWIGEEMEGFLEKSIDNLDKMKVLALQDVEAIEKLVESLKKDDHTHHHGHNHKHHHGHKHGHNHHHDHDHDEDWHIWLSPSASVHIAEQIASRLAQQMPEQKAKIEQNLAEFKQTLATKDAEIKHQLAGFSTKGYYTFHDAYGHFEQAYGLKSLGSFTINPTIAPGAKTLNKIKNNIAKHKAQCLFAEPQFTPKVIESLRKGTSVKVGKLDPLGEQIAMGKTAYPQFLQSIADQFSQCLAK
ncbi:MAG: zinc ABC transporter substrate-binding protein ZnuA [Pasteurellaceae bacterium]|nr:zinc ABC transporter substrate-binding protein ZnuA [Pasteurellaceae bacterium]